MQLYAMAIRPDDTATWNTFVGGDERLLVEPATHAERTVAASDVPIQITGALMLPADRRLSLQTVLAPQLASSWQDKVGATAPCALPNRTVVSYRLAATLVTNPDTTITYTGVVEVRGY